MTDDVVFFAVRLRHEHVLCSFHPTGASSSRSPSRRRTENEGFRLRAAARAGARASACRRTSSSRSRTRAPRSARPGPPARGRSLQGADRRTPGPRRDEADSAPRSSGVREYVPPLREALPPPDVILRDGMELREIEGNDPRAGQVVDLRLMAAGKLLLIACYRSNLERGVEGIGRHAEMMDDRRRRLVDDPEALLPQLKAKIHVLAVCRREVVVEPPELPEALCVDHETNARDIVDFSWVVEAREVGIVEDANQRGRAVRVDEPSPRPAGDHQETGPSGRLRQRGRHRRTSAAAPAAIRPSPVHRCSGIRGIAREPLQRPCCTPARSRCSPRSSGN